MNIIIVGCGKVGTTLAQELNDEENDITIVDLSSEKVNALKAKIDVMGVVGNGATHTTQEEAGIDKADLLIAVTGSDELNLLCCLIAKRSSNCKTIARLKNPEYDREASYLKDELGLAMVINPESAAAHEIARVLRFPSALKIDTFAKGRVDLIKFRLPEGSALAGMRLVDVMIKYHSDIMICTVERGTDAYIANGSFVFQEKDTVSLIATPENAQAFFKKIGYKSKSVKNVIIAGGGRISRYLMDDLIGSGINVKIIEKNQTVAGELEQISNNRSTIICGDATDQDLLLEESLAVADAFVALTGMDEENILLSLFAKSVGKGVTVTKINRIDFDDVIKHLELDSIIYPKNITADTIVRYVRSVKNTVGSNVETYYNFIKDKIEAAEFSITADSLITSGPISSLKLKNDVLIAAILRNNKAITPRGHVNIQKGDSVVILSKFTLNDITDILK